ncbi:MAG: beta-lactamase family protein [Candidatus Eremiobacteraeota bacterium]|nr:beta-lactamase family protein [Candidatus Eremiobacteraeota bacterium]MBV8499020.1 beta-lactamase family protein [Candidatus Eremiobacteraeota bacterium]
MRTIGLSLALAALVSTGPIAAAETSDPSARIDAYAREFIGTGIAPSVSIAITRDGQVVYAKAFGDRSIDPKLPAGPNTAYDGASLMKQFTAAALALLATQGKIDTQARLSRYLPQIPHAGEVTIAQLYGMTSGYQDIGEGADDATVPLATRITRVAARPLLFRPGTRWNYSNTNYELIGLLVEHVSGVPYATFMKTQIVKPLQLQNWAILGAGTPPADRATSYFFPTPIRGYPEPAGKTNLLGASGDILIDVRDMAAWDEALLAHRVVSAAMWRIMTTPGTLRNGSSTGYGAGEYVTEFRGHRLIWHGGNHLGSTAENWILPNDRMSITVLCNGGLTAVPKLIRAIGALYIPQNGGATPKAAPSPQPPPAMQSQALAWLQRALDGREMAADVGGDFAAMGRKYGPARHAKSLVLDDRGTVQIAAFSVELMGKPYTYYYDATKKTGIALLPVWNP